MNISARSSAVLLWLALGRVGLACPRRAALVEPLRLCAALEAVGAAAVELRLRVAIEERRLTGAAEALGSTVRLELSRTAWAAEGIRLGPALSQILLMLTAALVESTVELLAAVEVLRRAIVELAARLKPARRGIVGARWLREARGSVEAPGLALELGRALEPARPLLELVGPAIPLLELVRPPTQLQPRITTPLLEGLTWREPLLVLETVLIPEALAWRELLRLPEPALILEALRPRESALISETILLLKPLPGRHAALIRGIGLPKALPRRETARLIEAILILGLLPRLEPLLLLRVATPLILGTGVHGDRDRDERGRYEDGEDRPRPRDVMLRLHGQPLSSEKVVRCRAQT